MRQHLRPGGRIWLPGLLVLAALLPILAILFLQVRRPVKHLAYNVRQGGQLAAMAAALELYANVFGGYPPSDANDPAGVPDGGAMKLCEAMMGQDLGGCHFESVFRADGLDSDGTERLYSEEANEANMEARRGPYLRRANANVYRLVDVYGKGHTGAFDEDVLVLCDVYGRRRPSGKTTGMPILYYRADPNGTAHDVNDPDNPDNIYDYTDNQMLVRLGVPGKPWATHPLGDPKRFYINTRDARIGGQSRPHRTDSFILISAGYDGLYGTADDICNFDWKYRE